MTNEGIFPKVDGDRWYATDINNLAKSNNIKFSFNEFTSMGTVAGPTDIFLNGKTSNVISFPKLSADLFDSYSGGNFVNIGVLESSSSTISFETKDILLPGNYSNLMMNLDYSIVQVYDNFSNGSVSSALWTSAVTPTNGMILTETYSSGLTASTFNKSSCVSSLTTNDLSSYKIIDIIGIRFNLCRTTAANSTGAIIFTDGTRSSTIHSDIGDSSNQNIYGVNMRIYLNWNLKTAIIKSVASKRARGNSSIQTEYYPNSRVETYNYLDLTNWTSFKLKTSIDTSNTSDPSFMYINRIYFPKYSTTIPTFTISNDGGSTNYITSNGMINGNLTAGSSISAKIAGNLETGETLIINSINGAYF